MKNFPLHKDTLPGGLRTVLLPRSEGQTVTFLVLIGVGSRYETPRQSGLSHFLEHMFFKGTSTRPTAYAIAEAVETLGGEFNAFTGEEYTGYYVKVASEYLEHGAEVVADILLRPLFPVPELERERGVITEEIRMYTDLPASHVRHLWHGALFGAHPLGQRIDGSVETVSRFKQRDLLQYTNKHYHTGNTVIAVAGRFATKSTEQLLKTLFANLPHGEAMLPKPVPTRVPAQRVNHEYRQSLDQTHLIVGVPGISHTDPRRYSLQLLATVLGGGMSSRLFTVVRERHGLAYSVRTFIDSYLDAGELATQVGARSDKAELVVDLILQEYDRVMQEPIPEPELVKAKQMLRGHLVMELEETNSLAVYAGAQTLLTGEVKTPAEINEKIAAVTADEIQTVAQELLAPSRRLMAMLGPQRSVRNISKLLER